MPACYVKQPAKTSPEPVFSNIFSRIKKEINLSLYRYKYGRG